MSVLEVQALARRIEAETGKAVIGQSDSIRLLLVALLSSGHVLLEGPPGVAKTLLAQCFARATGLCGTPSRAASQSRESNKRSQEGANFGI